MCPLGSSLESLNLDNSVEIINSPSQLQPINHTAYCFHLILLLKIKKRFLIIVLMSEAQVSCSERIPSEAQLVYNFVRRVNVKIWLYPVF